MRVIINGSVVEFSADDVSLDIDDIRLLLKNYSDEFFDVLAENTEKLYIELLKRGIVVKNCDAKEAYKKFFDSLHDEIKEIAEYDQFKDKARELEGELNTITEMIDGGCVDAEALKPKLQHIIHEIVSTKLDIAYSKLPQVLKDVVKGFIHAIFFPQQS